MTEVETAWLAGILEGEGTFGLGYNKTSLTNGCTIRLRMTDKDVIEKAAILMKTSATSYKDTVKNRKPLWNANVSGDRAVNIIRAILPHMGARRSERINFLLQRAARRLTPKEKSLKMHAARWSNRRSNGTMEMF